MNFVFRNYLYDVRLFGTSNAHCVTIDRVTKSAEDNWIPVIQIWGDHDHVQNNGASGRYPLTSIKMTYPEKESIVKRIIVKSVCE
jgi:hypothetical protein